MPCAWTAGSLFLRRSPSADFAEMRIVAGLVGSGEQACRNPEFCPNAKFFEAHKHADQHGGKHKSEPASRLCPVCQTSMLREDASSEGQQRYHCPNCDAVVELSDREAS